MPPAPLPPTYRLFGWLFPRALACIYIVAFASWGWQADALTGEQGIMPVPKFLESAQAYSDREGVVAWLRFPTLYWLGFSDSFAYWLCLGSCVAAVFVMAGVLQGPLLLTLWFAYLSVCTAGDVFMQFQWDILLLEAGLLAALLSPWRLFVWRIHERLPSPSRIEALLPQALIFKLMLLSGIVKLTAKDTNWWNLTALQYHYETQPIPTWMAWYAHQLPLWLHQASCIFMFIVELGIPMLLLVALVWEAIAPSWTRTLRTMKWIVAGSFTGLMAVTLITGNYTFFNWLTILLSLSVLDDSCWPSFLKRWLRWDDRIPPTPTWLLPMQNGGVATLLLLSAMVAVQENVPMKGALSKAFKTTLDPLAPFRSINGYGLFRVMTTERNEIVIEVSDDGAYFVPLEFKWKPGKLDRPPPYVAPHQPRLDWQMWFAVFNGSYLPQRDYHNPNMKWFGNFLDAILRHDPKVLALLEPMPIPVDSIRAVRARVHRYEFTDPATRKETGAWWTETPLGNFSPTLRAP